MTVSMSVLIMNEGFNRRVGTKHGKGRQMIATQEIVGQMLRSSKGRARVLASISIQEENSAWLASRYDELREKYKDMFVAVHRGKVIAADHDIDKVIMQTETKSYAEVVALALIAGKRPLLIL